MRRLPIALLLAFFVGSPAIAQDASLTARDNLALTQAIIETERKVIVAANLNLTIEQGTDFWPVFEDFQVAMRKVNTQRANLIINLAKEFDTLEGDRAQEMLKESLKIEAQRIKIKQKFIRKFNKVLPAKTVVRYFQIESKLDKIVDYELAASIPLIRPDPAK
ncbi:MAG: hypothetical protein JRC77_06980 [Deltaproteobacteria bacterium]|nr:hypothetical protein [Deltaproteobacteria bacterium]